MLPGGAHLDRPPPQVQLPDMAANQRILSKIVERRLKEKKETEARAAARASAEADDATAGPDSSNQAKAALETVRATGATAERCAALP